MPDDFSLEPVPELPALGDVLDLKDAFEAARKAKPPDPTEPPERTVGRPKKPRAQKERGPVLAKVDEIEVRHPEDALVGDFVLCRGLRCTRVFRKAVHNERFCGHRCKHQTNYRHRARVRRFNGFEFTADLTKDLKRWETKIAQELKDRGEPRPETLDALILRLKQLDKPVPVEYLTIVEEGV